MIRSSCCVLLALVFGISGIAAGDAPATKRGLPASNPASGLAIKPIPVPAEKFVGDEQIGAAIEKGQTWLMGRFANGRIQDFDGRSSSSYAEDGLYREHGPGANALAVYALYQCGLATKKDQLDPKDKFMKNLLDTLVATAVVNNEQTYYRGIRATALASVNRQEDRGAILSDAMALLDGCRAGTYTYNAPEGSEGSYMKKAYLQPPARDWDNSNSQYGLLGVWSAAELGAEVPDDYWAIVEKHWTDTQCPDGQWSYGDGKGKGSINMTLAGLASLFVCHDFLDVPKAGGQVGREPFSPPLVKGLGWLEQGDHAEMGEGNGYGRYGLERVGLASGFKYFGAHDWYREQATKAVAEQQADGSFKRSTWFAIEQVETCYQLLFLARGRHPVLMSKLRFDHYWANRPRDLANLCKYAYRELETPFNWQVVPVEHDWMDWMDAPVLYIASHEAPKLSDADYAKLRSFAEAGGLLFTQADGNSPAFNKYIESVFVPKVFKDYELAKLPDSHELYSCAEQIKARPLPALQGVSNGARLLMVHSPKDLAINWQQRASKTHADSFELGINLFAYAGGKSDFRNRLSSSYIPDPPANQLIATLKVARVKYPLPTWDPEPYAWKHFSNAMAWQTSVAVNAEPVDMEKLGDLDIAQYPLAHLTGTNSYTPTDEQINGIKAYVEKGGTLLIDPCGGTTFNESIGKILTRAFAGVKLGRLPADHAAYMFTTSASLDMGKAQVRPYTMHVMGRNPPPPQLLKAGKGQVIYSQIDLTNGLLGSRTWGILGYDTPWATQFVKNLVLATAPAAK